MAMGTTSRKSCCGVHTVVGTYLLLQVYGTTEEWLNPLLAIHMVTITRGRAWSHI